MVFLSGTLAHFRRRVYIIPGNARCQPLWDIGRRLEILAVILSEAKDLARRTQRSFASLRMTGRTTLKSAHGKSSLQTSGT